jgi:hypothetical protein
MHKSPWRRIAITVSAMLIVLLLAASYRFVESRGLFASVEDKTPAACHAVDSVRAVTDIAVDANGIAYVAAGDGLYVYDGRSAHRLAGTPTDFHPAALALSEDGAINVLFRQGAIWDMSVFAVSKPLTLAEVGRLSADTLNDPADLAALPGSRFYLVNRHATHSAIGRWLDDTFLIPRAEVTYFDGMKFVAVAQRLNSPSSVAVARDGSRLYVAQELPRALVTFRRNEFVGALDTPEIFALPAAPTRITVAKDGSLIVAAWPKRGAGAVYRVKTDVGTPLSNELVYSSTTEEVAAAAEANGHLLIGTAKKLVDCTL